MPPEISLSPSCGYGGSNKAANIGGRLPLVAGLEEIMAVWTTWGLGAGFNTALWQKGGYSMNYLRKVYRLEFRPIVFYLQLILCNIAANLVECIRCSNISNF